MNPRTKANVIEWRQNERKRLLKVRLSRSSEFAKIASEIAVEIERIIEFCPGIVVSFYWPMPGEYDFLFWMRSLTERNVQVVLPVVISKSKPMIFRVWRPDSVMTPGKRNIIVPRDGNPITPDIVIAPLVGFDAACHRIGYGSGCFDRTLASLATSPTVVGVGHPLCEVNTIHPFPHDVPMDVIVLGAGNVRYRTAEG